MGKIVSKRAQKEPKVPAPAPVFTGGIQIHIFDLDGQVPLSAEEQEEIGRVFETIRKQLDAIIPFDQDWERLCQPY